MNTPVNAKRSLSRAMSLLVLLCLCLVLVGLGDRHAAAQETPRPEKGTAVTSPLEPRGMGAASANSSVTSWNKRDMIDTPILPALGASAERSAPRTQISLVPNGNFEQGPAIWSQYSSNGYLLVIQFTELPTSGTWAAWLGGDNSELSQLGQSVTVPAGQPYLVYHHLISSEDSCGWDFARVKINGVVVDEITLCDATSTDFRPYSVNLTAYAGRTVSLQFEVSTDVSNPSSYIIDDVGFAAPAPANAGWVELGAGSATGSGISNNAGVSWSPSLAIGYFDQPIVAWHDYSDGDSEIYVRRWNGSGWVEMGAGSASGGGISNNTDDSTWPSLAIGADGFPIVAWEDFSSGDLEIYVRRWNGSGWVEMGAGSASGGGISNNAGFSGAPSLAIGADGRPIVTWHDDSSGDYEIYIRRWNGSGWVEMGAGSASGGGISNNTDDSTWPSLAIGADGVPIIAWEDFSSGDYEVYVRRWNGSGWVEMGAGSAFGGGISNNAGISGVPSLAIGADDRPIIAWYDDSSGDFEIYVRRWNGSGWVEMGAGSASSGGISNNADDSTWPFLAIGADGFPVIAWNDLSSGVFEIYIRRWNGSAWVEMGAGSASGGGISNSAGYSWFPSLAIGADGLPLVAWHDWTGGDSEIYVRKGLRLFAALAPTVLKEFCLGTVVEREPNNNASAANGPVCSGRVYSGLPNDSVDMYYIDTTRTADLSVELSNHAGSGVQLLLYYQSVTGGSLVKYVENPTDGFSINHQGPAGRYYVVVFAATPSPSSTSRYRLLVTAK